jgi:hypothetical protein
MRLALALAVTVALYVTAAHVVLGLIVAAL